MQVVETLRVSDINTNSTIGYLISYCLPDGLWYGALLLFQDAFAGKSHESKIIFWSSAALPFAWELMQNINFVPGTFDPMDLMSYFIVLSIYVLSKLTIKIHKMKRNKSKIFFQVAGLIVFAIMAAASGSSKSASDIDWRGAAVGGVAGYNGYNIIGRASSNEEAVQLAKNKGYNDCIWDSVNGAVYAK